MRPRLFSTAFAVTVLVAAFAVPGAASTGSGTIAGATTSESCFASTDGSCDTTVTAAPTGAFSATATLNSPDSPLTRATRYSQALASYRIGFDLPVATPQATISVTVHLDDASASWVQSVPGAFGGTQSPSSGAEVLLQLLGHDAPAACGCGWPSQGAPDVVAVRATEAGAADSISDTAYDLTMSARNAFGDNLLPAGHYEVLLRAYALADLVGPGDWGTLDATMTGRIDAISVSTAPSPTNLTLSVTQERSARVLSAVLTDVGGVGIDGRTISFFADGQPIGTGDTENGVATLSVGGKLRGGSRLFTAEFAGDDSFAGATAQTST